MFTECLFLNGNVIIFFIKSNNIGFLGIENKNPFEIIG